MREYAVELKDVSVSFEREPVLEGISMAFPRGRLIAITGPSGSGKSTLLKIAAGLIPPDRGSVFIDGVDVWSLSRRALFEKRREHAFVFQDAALLSNLDVYNNLALPLRYHFDLPAREIERRISGALRSFGLEEEKRHLPAQLSMGEKKLVSFARGLLLEPRLIFLDEPVSGVDAIAREKIVNTILPLRDDPDITLIMVSHNIELIKSAADNIALVFNRRLFAYGTRDEILRSRDPIVRKILSIIIDEEAAVADAVLGVLTGFESPEETLRETPEGAPEESPETPTESQEAFTVSEPGPGDEITSGGEPPGADEGI
jgi:phospholipid/cholesterol/gamma-HCH transport system ATP-binding protein